MLSYEEIKKQYKKSQQVFLLYRKIKGKMYNGISIIYISDISQEMRAAFEQEAQQTNRPRLMVTAAVAGGLSNIQSGYQIPELGQ